MKTLVIAPQPFFSPRGTPFSVYYRTLILSELGSEIDFLTYGEGKDVVIPNVTIIRIPLFKILGNVKIGPSGLKLFLDIFIFIWTVFLLTKNKYDIIHAHEESIFFSVFLKKIYRFKLIYDMHSSLPQQLTNFKFTTSKFLIKIFTILENYSLKVSDGIITICPDLRDYVNSIIENKNKHFLIENSIFDDVVLKSEVEKTIKEIDLKPNIQKLPRNKKIILYAGTLEPYQGIDLLIKSFSIINKKTNNVLLIIVGGSSQQVKKYEELAEELGVVSDIVFTGRVEQKIANLYLKYAEFLVSPRVEGTNTPLKIYQQLASGKPLIATSIYSHTQVLTDEIAFLAEPEPEKFAEKILLALVSFELCTEKTSNAKKIYEEKYSRSVYKNKLLKLMEYIK